MKRHALVSLLPRAGVVLAALLIVWFGYACPVHRLTGISCPTCGITRATKLVLQGDFAGATRMHPLVWLAVPVFVLFVVVEIVGYARTRRWGASGRMRGSDAIVVITAGLLFALWVARLTGRFGGPV